MTSSAAIRYQYSCNELLVRTPSKLCYTILYYTVLYHTLPYCTMLCTLLYCAILYYTVLYCTVLYYTTLYYAILYDTIYTMLYYTSPEALQATGCHLSESFQRDVFTDRLRPAQRAREVATRKTYPNHESLNFEKPRTLKPQSREPNP